MSSEKHRSYQLALVMLIIICAYAVLLFASRFGTEQEMTTKEISFEDELCCKIDVVTDAIINENMSKEEKCRAVYGFIQANIDYSPRGAEREPLSAAYDALCVTGEGDCYSFFAVAKVLFDHLGIESVVVQRASGVTEDTHFWLLVNIGDGDDGRWYHFDATVMRADYFINSCLLTDAQVEAYSRLRPHFYEYDKSKYPKVARKIITACSNLDGEIGQ